MTGYDVLKRVLRVPVALRERGEVYYRDYQEVPRSLNLGATKSGKSFYQRQLVTKLAPLDVALGIDCKQGAELSPAGSPVHRARTTRPARP